jgi:hypothetical protein
MVPREYEWSERACSITFFYLTTTARNASEFVGPVSIKTDSFTSLRRKTKAHSRPSCISFLACCFFTSARTLTMMQMLSSAIIVVVSGLLSHVVVLVDGQPKACTGMLLPLVAPCERRRSWWMGVRALPNQESGMRDSSFPRILFQNG